MLGAIHPGEGSVSTVTLNLDGIGPQHYNPFNINIIFVEVKLDSLFKDLLTCFHFLLILIHSQL